MTGTVKMAEDTIETTIRQAGVRLKKGEDHIKSAGLLLLCAKKRYDAGEWTESYETFPTLCLRFGGIGISRGKELIAVASGKITVEELRAKTRQRTAKSRAAKQPLRSGQLTLGKTKGKNKNRIFDRIVTHLKTLSISELERAAAALGVEL
jgi:hypothetical protein